MIIRSACTDIYGAMVSFDFVVRVRYSCKEYNINIGSIIYNWEIHISFNELKINTSYYI